MMYLIAAAALALVFWLLARNKRQRRQDEEYRNAAQRGRLSAEVGEFESKSPVNGIRPEPKLEMAQPVVSVPLAEAPKEVPIDPPTRSETEAVRSRKKGDHRGAYKASSFLPPIKKGYQIYLQNMPVMGLGHRRNEGVAFIDDTNQDLRLELEPDNPKDQNAIKVIGFGDSGSYFLGYLPRNASFQIVKTNLFESVYARLVRAYKGTDDYLEIQLQIVGLKEKKKEFDAYAIHLPASESQKEYLKYWEIAFSDTLTTGDAATMIERHSQESRANRGAWSDFMAFSELVNEFDGAGQLKSYGLKAVPREILFSSLNLLRKRLGSLEEISEDPEPWFEEILRLHPELSLD